MTTYLPLVLVLALSGFGAALSGTGPQPGVGGEQVDELLDEGFKLLDGHHPIEALATFNRGKQAAPWDARPYFFAGVALMELGRPGPAASELTEAARLGPDHLEYRVLLADAEYRIKQTAGAAKTLAVFERPGNPDKLETPWLKLLADVYYRLEKADDALRILELLGKRLPGDPDVDLNKGQAYALRGDLTLAAEHLRRSLTESTHNPVAYYELGKVLYQRNETADAKQALLEAVKQDNNNPEYLYRLGAVCLARGETEEAIGYLKRAEPAASTVPQIYNALGQAYHLKGERTRGDEYRRKFQEITTAEKKQKDRNWEIERLIYQGEMQLDQGNKKEARSLFEQAAQADPSRWDPHAYLAEMFLASGELELAFQQLVDMEKIDSDSVIGNYLTAQYWVARKDYERARPYAEKAKFGRPGNSELRGLLGSIYRELGQIEKAREEFQTAVRLAPDRAEFREQLHKLEALENPAVTTPARQ